MAFLVKKYGGTSVGTVERIQHVARSLKEAREAGDDIVVVVSAMSGETNRLVGLARDVQPAVVDVRELDVLLSTGEQVTIALLSMALKELGMDACSYTGSQVRILTDDSHSKARIISIDTGPVMDDIKAGRIVVVNFLLAPSTIPDSVSSATLKSFVSSEVSDSGGARTISIGPDPPTTICNVIGSPA